MNEYGLYYKDTDCEYLLGKFKTESEAEERKDLLGNVLQEYPIESMKIKKIENDVK